MNSKDLQNTIKEESKEKEERPFSLNGFHVDIQVYDWKRLAQEFGPKIRQLEKNEK